MVPPETWNWRPTCPRAAGGHAAAALFSSSEPLMSVQGHFRRFRRSRALRASETPRDRQNSRVWPPRQAARGFAATLASQSKHSVWTYGQRRRHQNRVTREPVGDAKKSRRLELIIILLQFTKQPKGGDRRLINPQIGGISAPVLFAS